MDQLGERDSVVNRTKASVLALFIGYWVLIVVILVAAPAVYDRLLAQLTPLSGNPQPAEIGTLLAPTALLPATCGPTPTTGPIDLLSLLD